MSAMSSGTQPSCIPRSSSGSSPRLLTQAPPSRFSHPHLEGSLSGHQAKLSIDAAVSKLSRAVGRPQTSNSGAINFRLNGRGLASLVIIDSTNTLIEGEGFQATFATAVDRNPTAVNWLDIEQTSVGDGIFQPIAVPTPSAILLRRPTPSLIEFHTPSGSVSSNMHLFTHHSKLSYLSRRGPPAPITIPSTEALCSVEPQLPTFSTTAQSAHAQLQTRPPDVLKDNPSAEGSGLHSQETQRHLNLLTGDDDLQSSDELTVLEKALAPQTRLRELAGAGDVRSGPIRKNRSFRADSSKDCGAGQNQLCPQQDKFEPSQGRGQVGVVPAPLSDPSAIAPRETLGDSASTSQDMALRSSSPHTFHSTESTRRNVIPAPRRLSPSSESSTGHPLDHQPAPLGGAARTLVTSVSWSPTVSPKSVILPLPKNAGSAEAMKHLEVPGSALSNAMSSDSVRRDTYMPQSSDLLFSPEFIFSALGVPEHAQTTSAILPEDYSAVAGAENAQTIRGHEDAIGLEHVSAYWMTKEDSATLPLSPPILAAPNSGGGTRPRSAFDGAQIITSFASPTSGKYSPSMNPKGSNTENSLGTKTPVLPQRALTERSLSLPIEDASLTRVPKNNTATVDVSVSISNSVQASRSDGSSRSRGAAQVAVNALSRKGSKDRLALMADLCDPPSILLGIVILARFFHRFLSTLANLSNSAFVGERIPLFCIPSP
ncbi:uncharacterized protein EI90DRAFT_111385 [Cantharellus anzutake]|uniref:uncharacterized protein n=1 Tax=Cantharellus anzutake TaxID=1750568 RepID=UPI001906F7D1|nr:uncharacterized protein EI90DRAFT_111385 [Cantharellus anzutake]KAF8337117.1 hypothetical protein EI90DRAFT_111385 [Cantharellus anzutake]